MSTFATCLELFAFNRSRTIGLLDTIAAIETPGDALGWRPGHGRAHIAWQLSHIGITEELFGADRLAQKPEAARNADQWDRYRGGSTPDDVIPTVVEIRKILDDGRETMLETLEMFSEDQLDTFIWMHPRLKKEMTLRTTLQIIAWHEAHHHGQAHITWNLYRATRP